jgi:hypothetical protein
MNKGDVGKFLKAPNGDLEMRCLHHRVGECLLVSTKVIGGWQLIYYENINRTSRSARTTYGKYDTKIQKGGKSGLEVPFTDLEFNEENICKVLASGNLSEAKKFHKFNISLAKWEQEKIEAEAKAKQEAEAKAKQEAEDKIEAERKDLLSNPTIGSVWRPIAPAYLGSEKIPQNITLKIVGKHPTDFMATLVMLSDGTEGKIYLYGFHGYYLEKFERIS